jgi:hypothetical protein
MKNFQIKLAAILVALIAGSWICGKKMQKSKKDNRPDRRFGFNRGLHCRFSNRLSSATLLFFSPNPNFGPHL